MASECLATYVLAKTLCKLLFSRLTCAHIVEPMNSKLAQIQAKKVLLLYIVGGSMFPSTYVFPGALFLWWVCVTTEKHSVQ